MRIWVDLDNSPHVLFFRPLLSRMSCLGHELVVSAREHAQTTALCEQHGLTVTRIGSHGGGGQAAKAVSLASRSWRCRMFAKRMNPQLAVSHGSRALTVAAWSLGIPVVTIYDYEKARYGLFNRLSRRVLAPALIPAEALRQIGLDLRKLRQYSGVKEEVYLAGHVPVCDYRKEFSVGPQEALVVLRPPATKAHYHVAATDRLYEDTLRYLSDQNDLVIILLSRDDSQIAEARSALNRSRARLIAPSSVLDGPGLMMQADLVISGGGTMNREAALLGTPVYSIFCGSLGAIDRHFIECGRMVHLQSASELRGISIQRRATASAPLAPNPDLVEWICREILAAA